MNQRIVKVEKSKKHKEEQEDDEGEKGEGDEEQSDDDIHDSSVNYLSIEYLVSLYTTHSFQHRNWNVKKKPLPSGRVTCMDFDKGFKELVQVLLLI